MSDETKNDYCAPMFNPVIIPNDGRRHDREAEKVEDGGSAFPYCVWVGDHHNGHNTGMNLRDYFAGMALQGIRGQRNTFTYPSDMVADWAFSDADEMINRRKR